LLDFCLKYYEKCLWLKNYQDVQLQRRKFWACRIIKYLFTVLNKVDLASLWKVIMTLVAGKLLEYFTVEQLQNPEKNFNARRA
jgi:hypothetical protein